MTELVALYARVSSDEQREQHTIRTQLEYARGRAQLDGYTLREFVDDGVSGKKLPLAKRPAGATLLAAARRGEITRVVTYRLDRLGRRARFIHEALEDLTAAGVTYQSLTEPFDTATPAGKLFLGILAVMAEFESDSIVQRTSEGKHRVSTEEGRWLAGVVPYGYSLTEESRLIVDHREAEIVRQVFAWVVEGRSCRRIADELNVRSVPASSDRRGKRRKVKSATWQFWTVARMIRAELYAGRASFFRTSKSRAQVYRNVPAIVTPAIYLAARQALAASKKFGGSHGVHEYELRGLVACGRCGYTLIGRPWGKAHGYYCQRCPSGERAFVDEERLLAIVWRDVLDFLARPDATLRAIARSASEVGTAEDRAERELMELAQTVRELDAQEEQILELRLAKTISAAVLEKKAHAIASERERTRLRMDAAREVRSAAARALEEPVGVRKLLGEFLELAQRAGEDRARRAELIRPLTKRITFHARSGRLQIRYAFGAPATQAGVVAAEQTPARWP